MTAVASVTAAAAAAAAAGCGGDDQLAGVERYIAQANAVQQRSAPALVRANQAYARFSRNELKGIEADLELTRVEDTLLGTRARLAALTSPPEARALHRRLLEVFDANASFARESTLLARYLPAAERTLRPLAGVSRALGRRLDDADEPDAQVGALRRYAGEVNVRVVRLRGLEPPPVLVDAHRRQLGRLAAARDLARRLAEAIGRRDAPRVATLLVEFRQVQRTGAGTRTLSKDAIKAYDRRYRAVARATAAMRQEQARLERNID